jgi:hypothetical protein
MVFMLYRFLQWSVIEGREALSRSPKIKKVPPQESTQQERTEGRSSVSFKEKNVFDRINCHVDRMLEKGLITEEGAVWLKEEFVEQDREKGDKSKSGKSMFDCIDPTPIPNEMYVDRMLEKGLITEEEGLELEQLRSRETEGRFTEEEDLWLRHIRSSYFYSKKYQK